VRKFGIEHMLAIENQKLFFGVLQTCRFFPSGTLRRKRPFSWFLERRKLVFSGIKQLFGPNYCRLGVFSAENRVFQNRCRLSLRESCAEGGVYFSSKNDFFATFAERKATMCIPSACMPTTSVGMAPSVFNFQRTKPAACWVERSGKRPRLPDGTF
jgi:hypothetical protein